jgi:hypothetical protein
MAWMGRRLERLLRSTRGLVADLLCRYNAVVPGREAANSTFASTVTRKEWTWYFAVLYPAHNQTSPSSGARLTESASNMPVLPVCSGSFQIHHSHEQLESSHRRPFQKSRSSGIGPVDLYCNCPSFYWQLLLQVLVFLIAITGLATCSASASPLDLSTCSIHRRCSYISISHCCCERSALPNPFNASRRTDLAGLPSGIKRRHRA